MTKVSVFMPVLLRSYADEVMTKACVDLMRVYTDVPFELVIVETAGEFSQRPRLEYCADQHVFLEENPGVNVTCNIGFGACTHDLRAMMSNDVFVQKGWLEALVEPFGHPTTKDLCGASTLAACELGHKKQDIIREGIYFPCSMWHKDFSSYDERYRGSWGDADMCTRMYLKGNKKMFRNYKSMVHHLWNQTIKQDAQYHEDYTFNVARYKEKFKNHQDEWIYKVFTEGHII